MSSPQKSNFSIFRDWFDDKSIAIIGNSKGLFQQRQLGEIIDTKFEIVCRMNRAHFCVPPKTAHYSAHIGTKTDFLFVNNARTCGLSSREKSRWSYKIIQTSPFGYDNPKITRKTDFIPEKHLYQTLFDSFTKKPSTGMRVLHLLSLCKPKSVDVYGFDWKKKHPSYYGMRDDWSQSEHDFTQEMQYCEKTYDSFIFH
jgi:hypothetical protein